VSKRRGGRSQSGPCWQPISLCDGRRVCCGARAADGRVKEKRRRGGFCSEARGACDGSDDSDNNSSSSSRSDHNNQQHHTGGRWRVRTDGDGGLGARTAGEG
jgi:hypothetical protein